MKELSQQDPERLAEILLTYDFPESEYQCLKSALPERVANWVPRLRRMICGDLDPACQEHYARLEAEN